MVLSAGALGGMSHRMTLSPLKGFCWALQPVGHNKLDFAPLMNKTVVVILTDEPHMRKRVFINDLFVQVLLLSVPSTWITISIVSSLILN